MTASERHLVAVLKTPWELSQEFLRGTAKASHQALVDACLNLFKDNKGIHTKHYIWCLLCAFHIYLVCLYPSVKSQFNTSIQYNPTQYIQMTKTELSIINLYQAIEKAETRREVKALIRDIEKLKIKEKVST